MRLASFLAPLRGHHQLDRPQEPRTISPRLRGIPSTPTIVVALQVAHGPTTTNLSDRPRLVDGPARTAGSVGARTQTCRQGSGPVLSGHDRSGENVVSAGTCR